MSRSGPVWKAAVWMLPLAALVALEACNDTSSDPLNVAPEFNVVGADECASYDPEMSYFKVIKQGGPGTFNVVVRDDYFNFLYDNTVSLDAGDCAVVHFNNGPWHLRTHVTVTETSANPALLDCTSIEFGELGSCLEVTGNSAMHRVALVKGAVVTFTEEVSEPDLGRMTGGGVVTMLDIGGEQVKLTHGFTLHCDVTLSNNLEINWAGNQWHLDKESLWGVECTDDPDVAPEPPAAPFDTFYAHAIGRYNGEPGYEIEFTLQDAGEPGGKNDKAGMTITAPNGDVVLDVPFAKTINGNLQAHYDQPHK